MSVAVRIVTDTASPWLREMQMRVSPQRMANQLGPACERLVRRNFLAQGTNKQGWPSTSFWKKAEGATHRKSGYGFVQIECSKIGVRQRLEGGDIKPVNAGALTIPACPEAYGKTAADFANLVFGFEIDPRTGNMRPCLHEKGGVAKIKLGKYKRKDGTRKATVTSMTTGREVMFWLCKGVHQNPNPKVMPSDEAFGAEFDKSVEALMKTPL